MIRLLWCTTLLFITQLSFAGTEEDLNSIPTGEQGTVVSNGIELQEITLLGKGSLLAGIKSCPCFSHALAPK